MIDEEKILHRAFVAWRKYCSRMGYIYQQPANTSYIDSKNVVHLVNINGTLTKYKYYPRTDRLMMI